MVSVKNALMELSTVLLLRNALIFVLKMKCIPQLDASAEMDISESMEAVKDVPMA